MWASCRWCGFSAVDAVTDLTAHIDILPLQAYLPIGVTLKTSLATAFVLLFSAITFCQTGFTAEHRDRPLAKPAKQPAQVTMPITDLSPKFMAFYDAAVQQHAAPDRRWELWKQMYDFAAVPPTPEGEKLARTLLDHAWARYPTVLQQLRAGAPGMSPKPQATMDAVAALLQLDRPATVRLIAFVGGFEGNAFTAAAAGRITVAMPIEMAPAERALVMAHEFSHAVQIAMGSMSGGWIRSIGTTALSEGLAMRVAEKLNPGHPAREFVEMTPGWLDQATARRRDILRGILPSLDSEKGEDVMRFTMGQGPSGLEREAYYAGWEAVGYLLEHGMSFAEIARIPEKEMPARMAEALNALLATP
jgi:hypothetical protein